MSSPYDAAPGHSFWRTGVAEAAWDDLVGLHTPRFSMTADRRIASAGSCFAQHVTGRLRAAGHAVLDMEPPPPGLRGARARAYGFGLYSARYGNIYTARGLRQLAAEAFGEIAPIAAPWALRDRWVDGMRPTLEPEGLDDAREVAIHRRGHLERVRRLFLEMDVLVFTLGLTEAWFDRALDAVLPICPGVAAGTFDPDRHIFHNFTHAEVLEDLHAFNVMTRRHRTAAGVAAPLHILLTVSPVPLTATATGRHVLVATQHSKAVLRAAAAEFVDQVAEADYFPSYEIIASAWGPDFYDANRRTVTDAGVDVVMKTFFAAYGLSSTFNPAPQPSPGDEDDAVCDEALLEALSR